MIIRARSLRSAELPRLYSCLRKSLHCDPSPQFKDGGKEAMPDGWTPEWIFIPVSSHFHKSTPVTSQSHEKVKNNNN